MRFWGGLLGPCSFVSTHAVMKPNTALAAEHSWSCTRHSLRAGVCWPLRGAVRMFCCCMRCTGACRRLTFAACHALQAGKTPTQCAADEGHTAVLELLRKHAARNSATNQVRAHAHRADVVAWAHL